MSYLANSKNRKIKHNFNIFFNRISFNFLNLTISKRITLIWIIICFASLFFNWFTLEFNAIITNNAFSLNVWYIWFIVAIMILILSFLLLSNINKEKFKSKINIIFYDHTIIIFFGIIIFLLTLVIFNAIRWFTLFFQNITIWNGIIFELIWAIFIIFWWILNYRENKEELLHKLFVENNQLSQDSDLEEYKNIIWNKSNNKKNMSLPI